MASQMPYATYTQQHQQQYAHTNSNSFNMQGGGQFATVGGHPMPQASMRAGAAIHAWVPMVPQEQQYYDLLFSMADEEKRNSIGGRIAVAFFSRSNVDKSVLREIWGIADSQQRSELSRNEFYVAMRLIAMAQRGEPVSVQRFFETASMPHPLPMLEGVPPPHQLEGAPHTAYHTPGTQSGYTPAPPVSSGGGYAVTEEEKTKYDGIFQQYDTDRDGFLMGAEAVGLFQMSGLDRNILREIWSMADRGQDSKLDIKEFYVAMHLIVCISKRGLPMPTVLPADLAESAFGQPTFRSSFTLPINPGMAPGAGSGPPSRAGSIHGQEAAHADPMDAFAGLSPAKDTPMPNLRGSFTSAQSPPLSTSSSVDYTSAVNHPPNADQAPSSTGSFSGMGGLSGSMGPSSTRSSHDWSHANSPSLAPTPSPAAPAPERKNSSTGWNAGPNFNGSAGVDGMNHPSGTVAEQQSANMQRISGGNFMPMHMNMPQQPAAPASVQKPFMSNAEEHTAAQQLEQHNEQLVQSLTSIERKQAAIEKLSSKLRELDQLRHELVTLCMKRDNVRSATQAASASSLSSHGNNAEMVAKRVVEGSMHSLIAAEKEVLLKLQSEITTYEQQLEGSLSAAFDTTCNVITPPAPAVAAATHSPADISGSGFDAFGSKPSGGFDAFGAQPSLNADSNPSASSPALSSGGFDAFNAFDSSPSSMPAPLPQPTSTTSNDAFDAFNF